jgi:hypothetical protein
MSYGVAGVWVGGAVGLSVMGTLAIVLMAVGVWVVLKSRQTPAEREKKRRLAVNRWGRMGDANIIDVRDCILFFTYELQGVVYTTSQDVSEFKDALPVEPSHLIGPVGIKYTPKNPANSIIICEEWNGLRPGPTPLHWIQAKENTHP